jgi:hypothetical protein
MDDAAVEAKLRSLVAWGKLPEAEAGAAIAATNTADDTQVAPLIALVERWVR